MKKNVIWGEMKRGNAKYTATDLNLFFHLGCKQRLVTVESGRVRAGRCRHLTLGQCPLKAPNTTAFMPKTRVVTLMAKCIRLFDAKNETIAITVDKNPLQTLHMS